MNGLVLLLGGCAFLLAGYFIYSAIVAKLLGVDSDRPTPAHTKADGQDYVPTHPLVLSGSHFAAIAGAGPVIGPVLASQYGWGAVALWILLGCVFIGAMHDMTTLFLSVRNEGKSIGSIIEDVLGRTGKMIFLVFCFVTLIFVMAEFTRQVAASFVSNPEVASASLLSIPQAGVFGWLVYRKGMSVKWGSLVFVPMLFGLLWLGIVFPCDLVSLFGVTKETAQLIWTAVLLGYCFIASAFPVWLMLQPRGYLNAWLLYAMLALGLLGICVAHPVLESNAFSGFAVENAVKGTQYLFPLLFVTVACGACSGFHALVSSGTTSKQLNNEKDLRPVGYGAMLLEGVVALMALIAVAYMSQDQLMTKLTDGTTPVRLFADGLASFSAKFGLPQQLGSSFVMLAVAAFLMTTVDACTRLARFTWQEICAPAPGVAPAGARKVVMNTNFATGIVVALCIFLLVGCPTITKNLWTIFASGNQMLATLTLLTATLWLYKNGRKAWMLTFVPMWFMMATSCTAMVQLFINGLSKWRGEGFAAGGVLTIGTAFLFVLCVFLLIAGMIRFVKMVAGSDGR